MPSLKSRTKTVTLAESPWPGDLPAWVLALTDAERLEVAAAWVDSDADTLARYLAVANRILRAQALVRNAEEASVTRTLARRALTLARAADEEPDDLAAVVEAAKDYRAAVEAHEVAVAALEVGNDHLTGTRTRTVQWTWRASRLAHEVLDHQARSDAFGVEPEPVPVGAYALQEADARWRSVSLTIDRLTAQRAELARDSQSTHAQDAHLRRLRTILETAQEPGLDDLPEPPPLGNEVLVPTRQGTWVDTHVPNAPGSSVP